MPKVDPKSVEIADRQVYPGNLRSRTKGYAKQRLSDALGLSQFGIGEVTLQPGGATGLYHWHEKEDEFVYVLEGEATVVEGGETYTLRAGEAAGWKAGDAVPHSVENRSDHPLRLLELGTRTDDDFGYYAGIDMMFHRGDKPLFTRRDGVTPIAEDETPALLDDEAGYPDPKGQV